MELLSLQNIKKTYDKTPILNNINLSIKEGEFFTFLGPSGCGKTTLLRIIAGFIHPDEGNVFFEDVNITNYSAEKRNVGMVFQNYALFPFMTVYENVSYGLKIQKNNKKEIHDKATRYLQLVNLEGYKNRNVSELSGGEQQRVALARSLAVEPKLLLLDEPLSNLDARLRDKMRSELKEIQSKLGITTIFVTHDQTEALSMSDRIAVFDKGTCVQIGTPHEIYSNPANSFVANFIGDTNLLPVNIKGREAVTDQGLVFTVHSEVKGSYLSIRPQDIEITTEDTTLLQTDEKSKYDTCKFTGIVKKVSINGQLLEYTVTVGETALKVIKTNDYSSANKFKEGQQVKLLINPAAIKVLQD